MTSRRPKAKAEEPIEPLELDVTPESSPEPAPESSPESTVESTVEPAMEPMPEPAMESSRESMPETSHESSHASLPAPVPCKGCGTKAAPEQTVNLYLDLDTLMATIVNAANLPAEVAEQVLAEAGRNWEFTSVFKHGRWSVHLSRSGAVDISTDPVIGLI
jgi:hypothetical protein